MATPISSQSPFQQFAQHWSTPIEEQLTKELPTFGYLDDAHWRQAVSAAVLYGGKRIRPLLTIMGWQISTELPATTIPTAVMRVAAAVEFIHCSSLIFDDLPCMDNATLRRGSKTIHLEYGEDKAILVALGLLLKGIELVQLASQTTTESALLTQQLMHCVGTNGLIFGQWIDLSTKQSNPENRMDERLPLLRNLKTMPLIRFSLLAGAILANATTAQRTILGNFGELVGESYQLIDDLLDLNASQQYLGKDAALDLKNDRLNGAHHLETTLNNLQTALGTARTLVHKTFNNQETTIILTAFTHYLHDHLIRAFTA